uniref:Uncharacterized protein n=1 Tax=Solanum lycopersicum TaxID=4081 RepID=A0A3Q7IIT6_SOLLC
MIFHAIFQKSKRSSPKRNLVTTRKKKWCMIRPALDKCFIFIVSFSVGLSSEDNSRLADYLARLGEQLEIGKDADTVQLKNSPSLQDFQPIRLPKQTLSMESLFLFEHAHKTRKKVKNWASLDAFKFCTENCVPYSSFGSIPLTGPFELPVRLDCSLGGHCGATFRTVAESMGRKDRTR